MNRELETEWRRTWEASIGTSSWRQLHCELLLSNMDTPYIGPRHVLHIKALFRNDEYYIMLTDFTSVWAEALSPAEIKKRCKELNPSIEAPLSKILDVLKKHLVDEIEESDHGHLTCRLSKESCTVQLTTKLADVPFSWAFNCEREAKELAHHVTFPLVAMVTELARRQEVLFELLQRKDREIEERKCNGGNVRRNHLMTGVFDKTGYTNTMISSAEFESVVSSSSSPFAASQNLYFDVMMKKQYLSDVASRKPDDISDEESIAPRDAVSSWSQRVPASLANQNAATVSPSKSPLKKSTPEKNEDNELIRRRELEKRLREEEKKEKGRKKKKIKF